MVSQRTNNSDSIVIYTIDEKDFLVEVNKNWDKFARENTAEHLEHNQVLRRSLWDFIADVKTRHVHRVILERVRKNQSKAEFDFRCDSPSIRRYMQMQIIPDSYGTITYQCTINRIEHRTPLIFSEQKLWREKKILRMCSWCKKVNVDDGQWMEIEAAIGKLQLLERDILPDITHTMCDECLEMIEDK